MIDWFPSEPFFVHPFPAAELEMRKTLFLALVIPFLAAPGMATVTWHEHLDPAIAQAEAQHRDMLVVLHAEWCGWCRVLDREVFSSERFAQYARRFVLLRLDVDHAEDSRRLLERFPSDTLPMTLIVEPDLALVGTVDGYAPTEPYLAKIDSEIAGHQRLVESFDAAIGGSDAKRLRDLAREFHHRQDGRRAARLYRRLLELGWKEPKGDAWLRFLLADALRLDQDYDGASGAVREGRRLATAAGDTSLLERLDLMDIQLAVDRGDCKQQLAGLEAFKKHHPKSPYLSRVESTLDELKHTGEASCI